LLLEGTDSQISTRTVSFLERSQRRYKSTYALLRAKENEQRSSIVYQYKKGKTLDLYTKESEGKFNADCQSRNPKPGTGAEARPPPRHGAGETDGGRKPPAPCARLSVEIVMLEKLYCILSKRAIRPVYI